MKQYKTTISCAAMKTTISCPAMINVHMSMQGTSNGTERWCPVKRGGYISEVSFNGGSLYFFTDISQLKHSSNWSRVKGHNNAKGD